MAIVQISQITNRKGLQIDLPQLAGAELGWSVDERRLWIGNGTLEEGAPVVGNTEILTEFSDVLELSALYTYKGTAAGYTVQTGPTSGDPVTQSLQSWFDQWASIKDFGAVGDGVTDDTDAINRALYQIYCREVNPQIRRAIFFPAGVYRITTSILIPPYATLYGEGPDNSIIQMDNSADDSTLVEYVARTADSLQQYGANIGTNSAIAPQYITVNNLGFKNLDTTTNVFLVEDATNCRFENVGFYGPLTNSDVNTDSNDSAGVRFASTPTLITSQIVFDDCYFSGTTYALNTATTLSGTDQLVTGVTVTNSKLSTHFQGILLGTETLVGTGASGVRITNNRFDKIYNEGIVIGDVSLNATGYNIFYDVGNHLLGTTDPYTAIIDIQNNNNVSIGDMFQRTDAYAGSENPGTSFPRVTLNNTTSIAITNSAQIAIGNYVRQSGTQTTLVDNASTTAIFSINATEVRAFSVNYTIIRDTAYRTGTIVVTADAGGATVLVYTDDYNQNSATGVTLTVTQSVNTVSVNYATTSTGDDATMTYSITHLA